MIGRWTSKDAELLTGAQIIHNDQPDWRAVGIARRGREWRLVIENAIGDRDTIGRDDIASGIAFVLRGPVKRLVSSRELPAASLQDALNNLEASMRRHQLSSPAFYVSG